MPGRKAGQFGLEYIRRTLAMDDKDRDIDTKDRVDYHNHSYDAYYGEPTWETARPWPQEYRYPSTGY